MQTIQRKMRTLIAMMLKEKISQLEEKKQQYEHIQAQMNATGQREISLVDPDSRLMRMNSQRLEVGYNIQTSVDAKQHLIVDYDVINNSTDHHQLLEMRWQPSKFWVLMSLKS